MQAVRSAYHYPLTKRQKTASTLATMNSAVGHTAGIFSGIAVGVNLAKAMSDNEINSGLSIATGIVSAIAVMAGVSIATECASGAIRKKADIPNPLSMLCEGHRFDSESYSSLLKSIEDGNYNYLSEDIENDKGGLLSEDTLGDEDDSITEDDQETEHDSGS